MRGRARHSAARRVVGVLLGLSVATGLLSGCGAGADDTDRAVATVPGVGVLTTAPDGVQEITLQTQDDYVFTPDAFTVEPGRVRITVINVAKEMVHNFEFTRDAGPEEISAGIPLLAPGEEKTIEFDVAATGDHPFECSFHVQLNQVGTMTVRG